MNKQLYEQNCVTVPIAFGQEMENSMNFRHIVMFFLIILLGLGCGSKENSASSPEKADNKTEVTGKKDFRKGKRPPVKKGIPVEVTPVVRGDISNHLLYNATLDM